MATVEPVIPEMARGAPGCVDLRTPDSFDACPGRSVCFPGGLTWIPKDSPYRNDTGYGFCACLTLYSREGPNCEDLSPFGVLQLVIVICVATVATVGLVVTFTDGVIFVRRVRGASITYYRNLKAAELAAQEHQKKYPSAAKSTQRKDAVAPLSAWHWLTADPSFPLLISSSVCFLLMIVLTISEIFGIFDYQDWPVVNRYKMPRAYWQLALSFGVLAVNNVSLILLGVAWLRLVHKVSKRHIPSTSSNKSRMLQQQQFQQHSGFLSATQRRGLLWFERGLRVALVLYPLASLILFLAGYNFLVFAVSFAILFIMAFVFLAGSVLVRRLLERAAQFLRSISKKGDPASRRHRADALLKLHRSIQIVTLLCGVGIMFEIIAGSFLIVDTSNLTVNRLPGRDPPNPWLRYRRIALYLIWIAVPLCSSATSWFGRKFTQGLDLRPVQAWIKRKVFHCCFIDEKDPNNNHSDPISTAFRRSIMYVAHRKPPPRPAPPDEEEEEEEGNKNNVAEEMLEEEDEADEDIIQDEDTEVQALERFFFHIKRRERAHAHAGTIREQPPLTNTNVPTSHQSAGVLTKEERRAFTFTVIEVAQPHDRAPSSSIVRQPLSASSRPPEPPPSSDPPESKFETASPPVPSTATNQPIEEEANKKEEQRTTTGQEQEQSQSEEQQQQMVLV